MSVRRRVRPEPDATLAADLVDTTFRLVLGRPADPGAVEHFGARLQHGELDAAGLVGILEATDEHAVRAGDFRRDPALVPLLAAEDVALRERLRAVADLAPARFDELFAEAFEPGRALLPVGQPGYGNDHRERFRELLNAVVVLTEGRAGPRVLDIGVAAISRAYRALVPGLVLDTLDKPTTPDYPGFVPAAVASVIGSRAHVEVDLTSAEAVEAYRRSVTERYDLVVFTEVLEHLLVHPQDLLPGLLGVLADGGVLYLTTPNFFRAPNRAALARRENPAEVAPRGDENWDAHHHVREYAMGEVLRHVHEAGGEVRAAYVSACWDTEDLPEPDRGNLVVVATRRRSDGGPPGGEPR